MFLHSQRQWAQQSEELKNCFYSGQRLRICMGKLIDEEWGWRNVRMAQGAPIKLKSDFPKITKLLHEMTGFSEEQMKQAYNTFNCINNKKYQVTYISYKIILILTLKKKIDDSISIFLR